MICVVEPALFSFFHGAKLYKTKLTNCLSPGRSTNSCRANYMDMQGFPRNQARQPEFTGVAAPSPLQNPRSPYGEGFGQRSGFNQPAQGPTGSPGTVHYRYAQPAIGDLPLKARPSAPDPSMHPHLSHFAAVNEGPPTPGLQVKGSDTSTPGSDKKGKKRGRPSKAEYEIRAAEARARGDPWPPPKKMKIPRTSIEEVSGFGDAVDATTSKVKGGRKSKAKAAPGAIPEQGETPEGQAAGAAATGDALSPDTEAQPAPKTFIGTPEVQQRSTIPETQASEFPASDSLLTSMREHGAQSGRAGEAEQQPLSPPNLPSEAETAQSSNTIKQSSTPQTLPRSNMSQA